MPFTLFTFLHGFIWNVKGIFMERWSVIQIFASLWKSLLTFLNIYTGNKNFCTNHFRLFLSFGKLFRQIKIAFTGIHAVNMLIVIRFVAHGKEKKKDSCLFNQTSFSLLWKTL